MSDTTIRPRLHMPPSSPQAVKNSHFCPVGNCRTLCSPGHVVCRRHWRQIPQAERDPLIAAFQRRLTDPIGFVLACDLCRDLAQHYARLLSSPDRCSLNARSQPSDQGVCRATEPDQD